jgi:ribosomal protein S27AE
MENDSRCGKCGSTANFLIPGTPGDHSHIVVGDRLMRNIRICRRICTDCGYIEEWVNDEEDLKSLKAEYLRERMAVVGSTL